MKAVQISEYGEIEVLEIKDIPQPAPKEGQLLVEVYAASLNPVDWKIRNGMNKARITIPFPFTLGGDFAGVVKSAPEGSEFKDGAEVYGYSNILTGGSGSLAEVTASNIANTALKPKSLDFESAAAFPLVGVSALQALEQYINLQSGQKILIHGGAGGIGSTSIQLAKAIGAYVATTVNTDDIDFVKSLGADEVIDYKKEDFSDKLSGFDGVFDNVGGDTSKKSIKVLKKGGVLVSMLGRAWDTEEELAKKAGVVAIAESTNVSTENLNRLTQLIEDGKVKAFVDRTYSLEDIKDAFKYQEEIHPRGKVVIKIH